jgi:hypothetical protein
LHALGNGLSTHGVILPRSLQPHCANRPPQRSFRIQVKRIVTRAISCRELLSWAAPGPSREAGAPHAQRRASAACAHLGVPELAPALRFGSRTLAGAM